LTEQMENEVRTSMVCAVEISKVYDEKTVLDQISITVAKGGIHGILGPRGAGKTTLLELIAGGVAPDSGRIEIGGTDIAKEPISTKRKIGYVPQSTTVYSDMTVSELLNFVGQTRKVETDKRYRQIKEAIDLVGLESVQNRLTKNLTEYEKKKLLLAAALLGNPDVLLLDEPIPVCSAEQRQELEGLIRMLGGIKTVLLATRDFATARSLCQDVMILSDGRQLVADTFDALEHTLADRAEAVSLEELYRSLTAVSTVPDGAEFDREAEKEAEE